MRAGEGLPCIACADMDGIRKGKPENLRNRLRLQITEKAHSLQAGHDVLKDWILVPVVFLSAGRKRGTYQQRCEQQ
jgi:hypothetical protein